MQEFRKIVDNILNEMAYPKSFSIEDFAKLSSFQSRIKYCNERLKRLGGGSSRIAYQIDDEKVLKLARNQKGLGQNRAEIGNSYGYSELIAKAFHWDYDYLWVETELATKVTEKTFKKMTGLDFSQLYDVLTYSRAMRTGEKPHHGYSPRNETLEIFDNINNATVDLDTLSGGNLAIWEICNYVVDYPGVVIGDLCKASSWGTVIRNGKEYLVIIDAGFDQGVFDEYYKKG